MLKANNSNIKNNNLIFDFDYVTESTKLINESLSKGCDIAEFADGTIITTSIKITEVKYKWDSENKKFTRIASRRETL